MEQIVVDGRYALVRPLGGGGMAKVYLAHDGVLERNVAVKILREQYADDEEFVERFRREAQSAAALSHPHIVSIFDRGRSQGGEYYIAMEYVPGGTLKDRLSRDGALAPGVAAGVGEQIADALSAAHEKGVIHRDIKPQNVLVTRSGDIKVTDFGIARAASSAVTATSAILGTAGYMSPEQAQGKPVGPQSDLYSLGVVLYEMLTGNLPYEAESPFAIAMRHVNEPPPSPREANPEVAEALDAITMKLLTKDPKDRYPSAAALAGDLERVRSGLAPTYVGSGETRVLTVPPAPPSKRQDRTAKTSARPPVAPRYSGRGTGRRSILLFALLALVLGVAVIAGGAWAFTHDFALFGAGNDPSRQQPASRQIDVPDLAGLGRDAAVAQLQSAGLRADVQRRESAWDQLDLVIDQSPAAREKVKEGDTVTVYIGDGPSVVTVPDLVWESDAAGVLYNAGLTLGSTRYAPSDTVPKGQVIETDPAEGTTGVARNTAVNIVVSSGPAQQAPAQQVPAPGQDTPQAAQEPHGGKGANNRGGANQDNSGGKNGNK